MKLKPIPDFPDYFASDDGEIYSMKPLGGGHRRPETPRKLSKLLTGSPKYPHHSVVLYRDGKRNLRGVQSLILSAFVSTRPKGMNACHGALGNLVNTPDNLYWATQKQNMADKKRDGTDIYPKGETNGLHKLNNLQVRIIRRLYSFGGVNGLGLRKIAKIFNLDAKTIQSIIRRETWKHI